MIDETRRARLEALVEAYGVDVTRWPAADRAEPPSPAELDDLGACRDAAALDRLLAEAAARQPQPAPDALIDAIMAKTDVREAADAAPAPLAPAPNVRVLRSSAMVRRAPAAAAALMAASLAFGLFVGSLSTTQTTVAQIGSLAGLDLDATSSAVTFDGDFLTQDEEDIL